MVRAAADLVGVRWPETMLVLGKRTCLLAGVSSESVGMKEGFGVRPRQKGVGPRGRGNGETDEDCEIRPDGRQGCG